MKEINDRENVLQSLFLYTTPPPLEKNVPAQISGPRSQ